MQFGKIQDSSGFEFLYFEDRFKLQSADQSLCRRKSSLMFEIEGRRAQNVHIIML